MQVEFEPARTFQRIAPELPFLHHFRVVWVFSVLLFVGNHRPDWGCFESHAIMSARICQFVNSLTFCQGFSTNFSQKLDPLAYVVSKGTRMFNPSLSNLESN